MLGSCKETAEFNMQHLNSNSKRDAKCHVENNKWGSTLKNR